MTTAFGVIFGSLSMILQRVFAMVGIRVGCAVLATKDGRLLLGMRGKEPFYGKWVIPGGGIERFETFEQTAAREIKEETSLDIRVSKTATVAEIISPPDEHRVVIYLEAEIVGGIARPGSDLIEVGLFDRRELRQLSERDLLTPTVQRILTQLGWIGDGASKVSGKQPRAA